MIRTLLRLPPDRGFASLWTAQTISVFGDQITLVAIPTIAILALHVGPLEAGLLAAAQWVTWPFLGPIAGVWVDRLPRRPILVACDLARMVALLSIPLAVAFGALGFVQLLVVAAVIGVADVFFDVGFSAHLPETVAPANIPTANARLQGSRSVSYVAGPGIAGALIGLFGAASAVIVDAVTFLASAILIRSAPPVARERELVAPARRSARSELLDGLRVMLREPVLLRLTLAAAVSNLGLTTARTVLLLHLYRNLGLSPAVVGLVLAAPGLAAILGVAAAGALTKRLGVGRALLASTVVESAVWLLIPFSAGPAGGVLVALALGASAFWGLVWNIVAVSVRQVVVPVELQGRFAAIRGAIGFGLIPIGGLLGGLIGAALLAIGLPAYELTIAIGAVIGVSSGLALVGRSMRPVWRWQFGEPWPGHVDGGAGRTVNEG